MIGLLGGYGDVGLHAARILKRSQKLPLRFGGRRAEAMQGKWEAEFPGSLWETLDIYDTKALRRFAKGCTVLLNCAGPSWQMVERVAQVCQETGCSHVDAGIPARFENLARGISQGLTVCGAGATPGLSGLLPRWLGEQFDQVETLALHTGALGSFTETAADDYLSGLAAKVAEGNYWQNGKISWQICERQMQIKLPLVSRPVTAYPYFDGECQRVAESLGLQTGEWYLAVEGNRLPKALEQARGLLLTDRDAALQTLVQASALDAAGRTPHIFFLVEMTGRVAEKSERRSFFLEGRQPAELTGAAAALAVLEVLAGRVPAGCWEFAALPGRQKIIETMVNLPVISRLQMMDDGRQALEQLLEGEI